MFLAGLMLPSVASAGGLFCTANGSNFDLMLSVCLWADQTDGDGQTGKLAYMAEHTHQAARAQAQGKATNFLICFIATGHLSVQSVQSVKSVVKEEQPEDIHPSHPSYLYDSWLKWGNKKGSTR